VRSEVLTVGNLTIMVSGNKKLKSAIYNLKTMRKLFFASSVTENVANPITENKTSKAWN
jgi:hypothetical protein